MMPVVFFGHGSPMNAVRDNAATRAWQQFGRSIPPPVAVLCISAHWYIGSSAVTAMDSPRTLHDFGGFPRELYEIDYPAPGAPELAARVQELSGPEAVSMDMSWGLDHGSWSVLRHVFPRADIPVVQLSIDATQPAQFHYELGRRLAALRAADVLIAGSGGAVHNLELHARAEDAQPLGWAVRAEQQLVELLEAGAHESLIEFRRLGADVQRGIPTPEHYLPLLYVLGAAPGKARILARGIEGGSISLLTLRID